MILLKYQIDCVTFHLQTLQWLQSFSRVKAQILAKMCKAYDVSVLALLSSLSLLTPALPPSFQFPHKLIHSEPLYLFILVVRMPFLKYLYREDISLFSGVHCHQYHLFSRIPWSLNSVCFLIFLYPLSFVWLSLELLIF